MKILLWIQPTWRLHIGNYFGALKKWLEMQEEWHQVTFLIANIHAWLNDMEMLDSPFHSNLSKLWAKNIYNQHPETLELFYKLSHSTSVAELARLPQYQTKEQTLHMLSYPLLMAADIIISDCDAVIVWDDQTPHMQFYRDIAERNWYKIAETIKSDTPRIMSIKDPSKKMSKSLGDQHCIYLDEGLWELTNKIMDAPTTIDWVQNLERIATLYGVEFNPTNCRESKLRLIEAIFNYNYSIWK